MESYKVVFSGGDFHLGDLLFLSAWTCGASLWMYLFIKGKNKRKTAVGYFLRALLAIPLGLLFISIGSLSIYGLFGGANDLRHVLMEGTYHSVDGPVMQFDPMPLAGHKRESFVVKGIKFSYSDFVMTSGFNKTAAYGGPIHGNEYVRVGYLCRPSETDCSDPEIIKLEIRE